MKKLLMTILILFMSAQVFALSSAIAVGYQEKYTNTHTHDPIYISIDVWQDFNDLQIYGNYTNEMKKWESFMFYPSQDYYTVGVKYKIECFEIKLEHQCYHPVVAYNKDNGINGGYTKVEVTLCSN